MSTIPTAQETRARLAPGSDGASAEVQEDAGAVLEVIGEQIEDATSMPTTVGLKGVKLAILSKDHLAIQQRVGLALKAKGYQCKFINGLQVIEIDYLEK